MTTATAPSRIGCKFLPLTADLADIMIDANLTKSEHKLWLFIAAIDPSGADYVDLPSDLVIMERLGISKTTLWRAMSKLNELGLVDFQSKGFQARNLHGFSRRFKNETEISKMKSPISKMKSHYIYRDLRSHTEESECDFSEMESEPEAEPALNHSPSLKSELRIAHQPKDHFKDRCSAAAALPVENFALAVAEMLSNRLFIQWWANRMSKTKYGVEELEMPPIAYVRARIRKNPEQALDMYEAFKEEMTHRIEVVNQSVAAGIPLKSAEVEQFKAIESESDVPLQLTLTPSVPTLSQSAPAPIAPSQTNADAYRVFTADSLPERSEAPASFTDMMKNLTQKMGMSKAKRIAKSTNSFVGYQQMIQSGNPSLVKEALKWAHGQEDVRVIYTEDGAPYDLQKEDTF